MWVADLVDKRFFTWAAIVGVVHLLGILKIQFNRVKNRFNPESTWNEFIYYAELHEIVQRYQCKSPATKIVAVKCEYAKNFIKSFNFELVVE